MDIRVRIEGVSPLLCNRFTEEAKEAATAGSKAAAAAGEKGSPREQSEKKLYKDASGKLIIPSANLLSCVVEGGKFFKAGKNKVTTLKNSLIPACVFINEPAIPLLSAEGWCVDDRVVRNPATGGRFVTYRPIFTDWALEFCLELDEELMTAKLLREIFDAAGKRVGLGDFRPDRKGSMGRFVVTHWETKDGVSAANPPKRTKNS